jgi:NagD protein
LEGLDVGEARKSVLTDMDGVLVRGRTIIPGAREFIQRLVDEGRPFLVITNNSLYPPAILQRSQCPGGSAFVVGEDGLFEALEDIGYTLDDHAPDYVVLGETHEYSFERITRAIRLIQAGARFIATNPDVSGPSEEGLVPATGAIAALIERAINVVPYFIGKPNPLMIRTALRRLGEHSENAMMVGDRMDTDILTGIESGLETVLVLTGVTTRDMVDRFPYQPTRIVDSIGDVL